MRSIETRIAVLVTLKKKLRTKKKMRTKKMVRLLVFTYMASGLVHTTGGRKTHFFRGTKENDQKIINSRGHFPCFSTPKNSLEKPTHNCVIFFFRFKLCLYFANEGEMNVPTGSAEASWGNPKTRTEGIRPAYLQID